MTAPSPATTNWVPLGSGAGIPTPVVNGQWVKGSGGAAVWSAITSADVSNLAGLNAPGGLVSPFDIPLPAGAAPLGIVQLNPGAASSVRSIQNGLYNGQRIVVVMQGSGAPVTFLNNSGGRPGGYGPLQTRDGNPFTLFGYMRTAEFYYDGFYWCECDRNSVVETPWGFPYTVRPDTANGTTNVTVPDGANRCVYHRVTDGGAVTLVWLWVGVSSGNISVAFYRNSGAGRAAVPGALIVSSGSVACPTAGYAEIALSGGPYAITPGDWIALAADNVTAAFRTAPATAESGSALTKGATLYQASGFPCPTTPSGLGPGAARVFVMGGG